MNVGNLKINGYKILALTYLASAVGSPIVAALGMACLLLAVRDKKLAAKGTEAVLFCFADTIIYTISATLQTVLRLIPLVGARAASTVDSIADLATTAIFVTVVVSAFMAMQGKLINVPVLSDYFADMIMAGDVECPAPAPFKKPAPAQQQAPVMEQPVQRPVNQQNQGQAAQGEDFSGLSV